MRIRTASLIGALMLGGCAADAGKPPPAKYPERVAWTEPERVAERSGSDIVATVGTPFFALTKALGCVASLLVATPVAIGVELGERPDRALLRSELDRGVGTNCGGSYRLGAS
jgi:hypothetical protein